MSAIRPDLPATAPSLTPVTPTATARAAQAAFFRAALDQASSAPAPRAQPASTQPQPESEPRLPRPGALLDIRV